MVGWLPELSGLGWVADVLGSHASGSGGPRRPHRELLASEGWAAARSWGLKSIIDLRCPAEVGRRPGDPQLPEGLAGQVVVVSAPTEDHDNDEFRQTCFPILDSPEYWPHNLRILPSLVRGALLAVIAAEPGILIHCSAGRDCTGMVTALLLGNAGVPADLIADDYARSVLAIAGVATHAPTQDRQAAWSLLKPKPGSATPAPS